MFCEAIFKPLSQSCRWLVRWAKDKTAKKIEYTPFRRNDSVRLIKDNLTSKKAYFDNLIIGHKLQNISATNIQDTITFGSC